MTAIMESKPPATARPLPFPAPLIATAFLTALTLFHFWYSGRNELTQDESYYWQWSRHLAIGYYDNTPLMAFIIRFFTSILGSNEYGVRAGAVVCGLVATIFIYLLASRMLGEQTALIAVLIAGVMPLFSDGALIMTTDPVVLAFWASSVYTAWRAVEPGSSHRAQAGWWVATGVLAGLTIMAKLNGALIMPAVLLYVVLTPSARHWLRSPWPYVAALLALIIFLPFEWWNHTHVNAFWIHIHAMTGRGADKAKTLRWTGEFLGAQAILVSPLIFLSYLWTLRFPNRNDENHMPGRPLLFLWCSSVIVFAATVIQTFRSRVEGNWAVDAYVTGIILIAYLVTQSTKPGARIWHWVGYGLAVVLTMVALFPGVAYSLGFRSMKADRTNELHGWSALARRVASEQTILGGPARCFVFGINYRMPSEMAFYLPGQPVTYSLFLHDRANEYMFWNDPNVRRGDNAVFINDVDAPDHVSDCRAVFQRVMIQPPILIYRRPYIKPIRTVQLFRCYGFKGYDPKQWQKGW